MQIYSLPKDFQNTMSQLQPKIIVYAYKYNLAYQHLFEINDTHTKKNMIVIVPKQVN